MNEEQIATLKQLLDANYSDSDLRRLCYDNEAFKPVYRLLKQNTSKAEIIRHLVDQAQSTSQLGLLNRLAVDQSVSALRSKLSTPQAVQTVLETGSLDAMEATLLQALTQAARPAAGVNRAGQRGVVGSHAGGNIITGNNNQTGGVRIGKVGGNVSGQIAGRDINQGLQPSDQDRSVANPQPSAAQLSQDVGLPPTSLPQILAGLSRKVAQIAGDRGVAASSAEGDIITGDGNQTGGVSIDEVVGDITGQIAGRDITGSGQPPQAAQPATVIDLARLQAGVVPLLAQHAAKYADWPPATSSIVDDLAALVLDQLSVDSAGAVIVQEYRNAPEVYQGPIEQKLQAALQQDAAFALKTQQLLTRFEQATATDPGARR